MIIPSGWAIIPAILGSTYNSELRGNKNIKHNLTTENT